MCKPATVLVTSHSESHKGNAAANLKVCFLWSFIRESVYHARRREKRTGAVERFRHSVCSAPMRNIPLSATRINWSEGGNLWIKVKDVIVILQLANIYYEVPVLYCKIEGGGQVKRYCLCWERITDQDHFERAVTVWTSAAYRQKTDRWFFVEGECGIKF